MITIRKATEDDCILFFLCRYGVDNPDAPPYKEHIKWYKHNYKKDFYVVCRKDAGIGYIRLDKDKYISIAFCPWEMHKGNGKVALCFLVENYCNLKAKIHETNMPSRMLFEKFPQIEVELI